MTNITKKRNPADMTRRNIVPLKRRITTLESKFDSLLFIVSSLEQIVLENCQKNSIKKKQTLKTYRVSTYHYPEDVNKGEKELTLAYLRHDFKGKFLKIYTVEAANGEEAKRIAVKLRKAEEKNGSNDKN